jgi:hypothetical protein
MVLTRMPTKRARREKRRVNGTTPHIFHIDPYR